VLYFAKRRGLHASDGHNALDCCAVLEAPKMPTSHAPRPIAREDFAALWDHIKEDRLSAWLLCMLNPCLYPGEVLSLDWGEVDLQKGTVVTSRSKTNVIRIGVLWPRTITALKAIWTNKPKREAPVFLSKRGGRLSINMVSKEFRTLRRASGVAEYVKAEHCRDGAYTAAIEAGVALTQAKLLAGHATGISDHYAKRRPTMVSDAIKAIEKAYFG
jgi:integrase